MTFIAWVWLGMILGVSFLAAPAKFQAETLTLPVALEVGRVTFGLFDRLEWLWTAALIITAWRRRRAGRLDGWSLGLVAMILAIVCIQSWWFLPALDVRVSVYMAGETPPPSPLHLLSGFAEVVQAAALAWLGWRALERPPAA
ncbi:MAG: DUF4149 domain-containing protein [Acidobacteriota bacterium]